MYLQILLEALYFSLVAKRLHPEEDDTLVEHPFVEHVSEKIGKVRPPQGFALFQAKEEARKVKLLHSLLKVKRGAGVTWKGRPEPWDCAQREEKEEMGPRVPSPLLAAGTPDVLI